MPFELASPQAERLRQAEIVWLATVRPNGSPHLVPIWAALVGERLFMVTSTDSVKVRNLAQNSQATVALQDGRTPLVIEGTLRRRDELPETVRAAFVEKYDWGIELDQDNALLEFEPTRVLLG